MFSIGVISSDDLSGGTGGRLPGLAGLLRKNNASGNVVLAGADAGLRRAAAPASRWRGKAD